MTEAIKDYPNNGHEITSSVKEGDFEGVDFADQQDCPYEPLSTGARMKRGKNPKVFDNNNNEDRVVIPPGEPTGSFGGWGQI